MYQYVIFSEFWYGRLLNTLARFYSIFENLINLYKYFFHSMITQIFQLIFSPVISENLSRNILEREIIFK